MSKAAAVGFRAHTGWAAFVVVAGGVERSEVLRRGRAELADPAGRVRRNVYQRARGLDLEEARARTQAAERVATEQAQAAVEQAARDATEEGAALCSCAVIVGAFAGAPLESILASHALAHAAEGRLYQEALLRGAESCGFETHPVLKRTIWDEGEAALGVGAGDLREWIGDLRREVGPPWAEDQKLAALAAWIALARRS